MGTATSAGTPASRRPRAPCSSPTATTRPARSSWRGRPTGASRGRPGSWTGREIPGCHVSIAASGGLVAVAYQETAAADLRCAVSTDSGSTWHRYPVDAAGTTGLYTSTAIGPTGTIHIAYHESIGGDLKLAWSEDQGATWGVRILEGAVNVVGLHTSIAVNGSKLYVAYYDATAGDLRFGKAAAPDGSWSSSALDATGNVGQYTSLRYDPASATFWLAYYDVAGSRLKIAKSVGNESSWSPAIVVDDDGATGQFASLSVTGDSGQHLAIAYYEDWEYRLKVARSDDTGASWTAEVVADDGVGQWASIAATGEATWAVSCYDPLADDLRFAAWNGTGWTVR